MPPDPEKPHAPALEREASFQLLFHEHPLPMWVVDAGSLQFLAVNETAVRKYGYSREEFLGMTMDQIAEPEQLPPDAPAEPESEAPSDGGESAAWRHTIRDGSVLHVESTWHEISFDGREAVLVLTIDRTAQRLAEERNREQAKLLNLASDAIIVRDLDQRLLFWNQGAERLYGWTSEEAVGAKALDLFVSEKLHVMEAEVELLRKGVWSGQLTHKSKEGREVIVNSRWTLVRDEAGEPQSVLVIDTDITETKKLESQFLRAQRLESIGTLASGIAHDLNNILSPILMAVSIQRRNHANQLHAGKIVRKRGYLGAQHGIGGHNEAADNGCDHRVPLSACTTSRSAPSASAAIARGTADRGRSSVAADPPSECAAASTTTSSRTSCERASRPGGVTYRSARTSVRSPAGIPAASSSLTATSRAPAGKGVTATSASITGAPAARVTAARRPIACAGAES